MAETKQRSIYERLAKAWANIKNPELDSVNPYYQNKYASLKATEDVIRQACAPEGLIYRQLLLRYEDGTREFHSFIVSEDGYVLECSVFPVEIPRDPQAFGSNCTYAKRQQAQADWCIAGEDDDDANSAAESLKAPQQAKKANSKPQEPKKTEEQKKKEYLARVLDLREEAQELGVKEQGINSFIESKFKGKDVSELDIKELTVLGKHLSTLITDIKSIKEEEAGLTNE